MTTLGLILNNYLRKILTKKSNPKKHYSSTRAVQRHGKIFQYPILFCQLLKQYLILHKKTQGSRTAVQRHGEICQNQTRKENILKVQIHEYIKKN